MPQNTKEQEITNWSWQSGSKHRGFLPVYGGGAKLPVTLICGNRPGPMVLISGGVHSSEYVGIQAAIELSSELMPEQITGSVVLIPLMNPYQTKSLSSVHHGPMAAYGEIQTM